MTSATARMRKTSRTVGLVAFAILASQLATADDTGWYGGANIGQARAKIDNSRITDSLLGGGLTTTAIQEDEREFGYKLFGGYQFNKNFAIEGGYFDLGEFGFDATTVPAGSLKGNIRLRGVNVDALAILPITDKLSAFGRVGVNYAEARDSFAGSGAVVVTDRHPSKRDTNYKYGAGLQYAVTDNVDVRAEAERYRINDAVDNKGDIDMFSVGVVYRYDGKTYVEHASTVAPEPVAVAAAPAAEPAAVPEKVSFSADSLFDFDRSDLRPNGKHALDKMSQKLQTTQYSNINVIGHTDRLGPQAYNQKLSTRRAQSVQRYLIDTAGIPADKITARGVDGSDPVTKPGDCIGEKATKTLIACLQPDRRVEVDVFGTKEK
ncbi:MAG TPA: OmpA family protein [Pseudomonadales bacterium]|nr:OmpA family protein [Pseudomonadales bacterium]